MDVMNKKNKITKKKKIKPINSQFLLLRIFTFAPVNCLLIYYLQIFIVNHILNLISGKASHQYTMPDIKKKADL